MDDFSLDDLKKADPTDREELLMEYLEQVVKDALGYDEDDELDEDMGFTDLGMDSNSSVKLSVTLQEDFDTQLAITPTDFYDYPTIEKLAHFIEQKLFGSS